jgi:hypothetical protein
MKKLSLAALCAAVASLPAAATPAAAATSAACAGGGFAATLPSGQTVVGKQSLKLAPSALDGTLKLRGRYVEFDVDPATLGVRNYTFTGAANVLDITGGARTPVFAEKTPQLPAPLTGELELRIEDGDALITRRGSVKMKIQAKDCAQGGLFQMEPEAGQSVVITHTLAAGMFYFVNPYTGRINFGNGTSFRGKDSPQVATRLSQTDTQTTWSVAGGGRMGAVFGEDAVELSAGASSCVEDCQAQNRIRGSLPVTDPAFSG